MNPIQAARAAGQQIWLDNLSRSLINSGQLARHIEAGVAGVTTNPAIFHKAIADGHDYRPALDALRGEPLSAEQHAQISRSLMFGPITYGIAFVLAFFSVAASFGLCIVLALYWAIAGFEEATRKA